MYPPPPQVSSLNSRKSLLFTGALALIFAVFSLITCKPSPDEPTSGSPNTGNIAVTGVTLSQYSLTLTVGGRTETLTATIQPASATNKNVIWTSSNNSVATVSGGVVSAVAAGSAIITVTTVDGGKTATCSVTVNAARVAVSGVTLDYSSLPGLSLTVGGTATFNAIVEPDGATNKNVTWTSDNESVATVSGGVVTAVSAGTANITVTTEDGAYTASCMITVQALIPNTVTVTITFDGTHEDIILNSTGNTQNISDTVTFSTANAGQYSDFRWILDGVEQSETSGSITFNRIDLAIGPHRLTVIAFRDGIAYSQEQKFTVSE